MSVASFAVIFAHFEGCLLTSFVFSFAVQKHLSLIESESHSVSEPRTILSM